MEKSRWLEFLSSKLRSQIILENAQKAQVWALGSVCLISLGFALQAISASASQGFIYSAKVLFLVIFHAILFLAVYLPAALQKGEKPLADMLSIQDFTSLIVLSLVFAFYSVVNAMLSYQTAAGLQEFGLSNFFGFAAWSNFAFSMVYLAGFFFYFLSLLFFPQAWVRFAEKTPKASYIFLGLHGTFFCLVIAAYGELAPVGSLNFFEQLRVAGLFWVFLVTLSFMLGRVLRESSVAQLADLELGVASGRFEKGEEILARLNEISLSRRFTFWLQRLHHHVARQSHEITRLTHEAVALVSREKPTELDLRQVEERHRRADALYKRFDRDNQRFLLSISFLELSASEREKAEQLKDFFSRELRNAKLELASVRKRIDERLVALKNAPPLPVPAETVPTEKIPVSR